MSKIRVKFEYVSLNKWIVTVFIKGMFISKTVNKENKKQWVKNLIENITNFDN